MANLLNIYKLEEGIFFKITITITQDLLYFRGFYWKKEETKKKKPSAQNTWKILSDDQQK